MKMDCMNVELCPEFNVYTISIQMSCTRIQCLHNVCTMSCIHEYGAPYSKNGILECQALT